MAIFDYVQKTPNLDYVIHGCSLNLSKRYKDELRVIFNQSPKLHIGLDALSHQKILNGL